MNNRYSGIRLSCRTRGNTDPKGKPRIYFTCHPDDMGLYFEEISSDLLRRLNCAVWFKEDPEDSFEDEGEIVDLLGQMQLFVIPVTTRLLSAPCDAMDREYAFAAAHHIPVLPLMEEERIDDLFTRRFGEIQYLSPRSVDPTAISFDVKMDRFLSKVLVEDETAGLIRNSFDAYIFLSYRKKDRRQALQLMRLIHRNPKCEGLAIWYDEYLVANENFNDAIRAALDRSSLFTLVVTPNLVNEPNYVMQVEYPAAKNAGKTILPVETEDTDRQALEEYFEGIPGCVRTENEDLFWASLLDCLPDASFLSRKDNPERDLYIGLAYLDGIDVEVDHARARMLIERAAGQGLIEAMDQLARMYDEGIGVPRDEELSLFWRYKIVATLKNRDDIPALCSAMQECADACFDMQRYAEAKRILEELIETADRLPPASVQRDAFLSAAYETASRCAYNLGQYEEADSLNVTACRIRFGSDLANAEWTEETYPYLYDHFLFFATSYSRRGLFTEALHHYELARSVVDDLFKAGMISEDDYHIRQAYILLETGIIERQQKQYGTARKHVYESLDLYSVLAVEDPVPLYRRSVMTCYIVLGNIEHDCHHFSDANRQLTKALDLGREMYQETGSIQIHNIMATVYRTLAEIALDMGQLGRARKIAELYRDEMEELYNTIDSRSCKEDYARSFFTLARICLAEGNTDEAERNLNRAESILLEEYDRQNPDPMFGKTLVEINYIHGDAMLSVSRLDRAAQYLQKALDYLNEVRRDHESLPWLSIDEAVILERLGIVARKQDNLRLAQEYMEKALAIYDDLASGRMHELRDGAWTIRQSLGDIAVHQNQLELARKYYLDGLEAADAFAAQSDNPMDRKGIIVMCQRMGIVEQALGHFDSAKEYYLRMHKICGEIADHSEGLTVSADLSRSCRSLGDLEYNQGHYHSARSWYEEARNAAIAARDRYGDAKEAREVLAFADISLGNVLEELGEIDRAKELLLEGVSLSERIVDASTSIDDQYILFNGYLTLMVLLGDHERMNEAEILGEKMLALGRIISENAVSLPMRICWYRGLIILAALKTEQEHYEDAVALYSQALADMEAVYAIYPQDDTATSLATSHRACAEIETLRNNLNSALQHWKAAIKWADSVQLSSRSFSDLTIFAQLYFDYGSLLSEGSSPEASLPYLEKAYRILSPLAARDEYLPQVWFLTSQVIALLGGIAADLGRWQYAASLYLEGADICNVMQRLTSDPEELDDLRSLFSFFRDQHRHFSAQ